MTINDLGLGAAAAAIEAAVLLDEVQISAPDGAPVLNRETGLLEPRPGAVLWSGPGAVVPAEASGQLAALIDQATPDSSNARYRGLISLSAKGSTRAFGPDDIVRVTASRLGVPLDPQILLRRWRIADQPDVSTLPVLRILPLEEL